MKMHKALRAELLVLPLLFIVSGCDFLGSKKETATKTPASYSSEISTDVVVSMDGRPLFTAAEFQKYLDIIEREQPSFKEMVPLLPVEQQSQVFQGILDSIILERLMSEWVKREGIDKNPEYQENARLAHEMIDRQLALQAFQTKLLKEVAISDAEANAFYTKNRATEPAFKRPPFLVKAAGTKAQAIVVDTEKEAKELLTQVKASNLSSVAKKANKTTKDLGVVNPQSYGVDNNVKSKIVSFKQFPAKDMVKGADGKFYVIEASGTQNAEYAPFEEVKEQIKQMIMGQKLGELFAKRAEELKAQYKVEVNPNFVKSLVKQSAQETRPEADAKPKASNAVAA